MGRRCHANFPIKALDGAPYGAAKRARGVPKLRRWCHANFPTARGPRCSSLWGREACEGVPK
eukprot:6806917-Pyramimonas_sp.AAC.1